MNKQVFIIIFIAFVCNNLTTLNAQVVLPAGTPVTLTLKDNIDPILVTNTTILKIAVTLDVVINQKILISTNAFGEAGISEIKKVKKAKRWFWAIDIEAQNVQGVDGKRIELFGDPVTLLIPYEKNPESRGIGTLLSATVMNPIKIKD